jgi:DNA-binding HxlR family transcriptional regulator
VLRDILFFNKAKFDEFLDSPEKISTNILTDRLHKLEAAGLIAKAPYSNHRLRMAYSATEKGKSLAPILKQLVDWGLENLEDTRTKKPPSAASS